MEPSDFCKVSLEEFVTSGNLKFDVHVLLGNRYVKIGRQGHPAPIERFKIYRSKGLKHLYVRKEDFRSLVAFNIDLAKTVKNSQTVSPEKKANFIRYTGEVLLEKAFIAGVDEEAFLEAKDFLNLSIDLVMDEEGICSLIESLNSYSDIIYAHSLFVSTYSVLIAKRMGWTSSSNLFKLSLAGVFHDIGKKEIERELLQKPRKDLTPSERKIIESHPQRGREILMALPSIPPEAVAVAYEHHEDLLGTGFPRGITKHQIHTFSHIVRVANLFADLVIKGPNYPQMTPAEAIKYMGKHFEDLVLPEAFRALKGLFPKSSLGL